VPQIECREWGLPSLEGAGLRALAETPDRIQRSVFEYKNQGVSEPPPERVVPIPYTQLIHKDLREELADFVLHGHAVSVAQVDEFAAIVGIEEQIAR
jgi:hypothetical protein